MEPQRLEQRQREQPRVFPLVALFAVFAFLAGLALPVFVGGCSSSDDDGTTDAYSSHTAKSGTYEVPVPADLEAAAQFPVDRVGWRVEGNQATLRWTLPVALTGNPEKVDVTGPYDAAKDAYVLTGEAGTAECRRSGTSLDCTEHLTGIKVDKELAISLAEAGVDLGKRKGVIDRFSGDPIGILHAVFEAD
ncbi:hypothetical protein AKJ09_10242 [Labilithrix luteola]|uniref:Uncharacterized protein n=1 Tax=Labilithrix luteola TaxID=1391654 RepID=A0A0K1QCV0_9BACT|nr:hypothetical protein [Labilithrix luteola]AKV03579.1 hypothetical protein AKJ09_10242 [Labilithrix luteola]